MGIWDTVPALGTSPDDNMKVAASQHMALTVSNKFKYVASAIAVNESRAGFEVRSIYANPTDAATNDIQEQNIAARVSAGKNVRVERGFMGAHSDVGGGYTDGDLSNVALMWMINQAKIVGVNFNDTFINKEKFNVVSNPIVHDSVGDVKAGTANQHWGLALMQPSRQFAWANDNNSSNHINQDLTGLDAKALAQYLTGFVNPADQAAPGSQAMHLKLNWVDTLGFENANGGKKFEQTLALEKKYDTFCGQVSTGHACQPLQDYQGLKTKSMDDNGVTGQGNVTTLYDASKEKQAIQITKYLNWIKDHYSTKQHITSLTFQAANGVAAK